MRYRDRLPRLRRARMARQSHDRSLRHERSVPSGQNPGLRLAWPAARRNRPRAGTVARHDLAREEGNRIYFGYGTNKNGVMQIVDREGLLHGPREPTAENLLYPEVGRLTMTPFNGAHTTFPMPKMPIAEFAKDSLGTERDIVMIVDEQIRNACQEPRQMAWFVDVTIEAHPMIISNFQVSEASGDFCSRGGRFGTHA